MEEIIKLIAAGGGIGVSATWAYWLWRIEPRLRSLEITILRGQKIDMLHMVRDLAVGSDLHAAATNMLEEINDNLKS